MEIDRIISALERRTTIPGGGFTFDEINTALTTAISLLKAQQEDRLVVLPCAIGTPVYVIKQAQEPCLRDPDICPHSHGHVMCLGDAFKCQRDCPVSMDVIREVCRGFEVRDTNPIPLSHAGRWNKDSGDFTPFYSDYGHYLTREEAEKKAAELNSHVPMGGEC